jgi:transcriptional regulator with XRE-family HTH domain
VLNVPTLKASTLGLARIKQARNEKGWSWSTGEDACLVEASKVLEPERDWFPGGPYANGISEGTWKRFLAGRQPISAAAFKAYCQVLGLNWEEIVGRQTAKNPNTRHDWGEAIDSSIFYGRTTQLAELERWIVEDRCRIVALLGMGGIGKTALAVKLAEQIQKEFEYLMWRSLRNAPPVNEILSELIEFLSDRQETDDFQVTSDTGVSHLLEYLRTHRCLLLLDDVETVLCSGELAGQYREGYQGYGELIKRVGEERHQSCLVLISREKPVEISSMAGTTLPVRELKLKGLPKEDAKKILESKGISGLKRGWEELIALYRGNPLALKIMATTIQEIFNGNISQFLEQSTLVMGDVLPTVLHQQFERLSALEEEIIYWLAIENMPISLSELKIDMQFSCGSFSQILAALESLKRRSMLEEQPSTEDSAAIFTLQPVIMKYITNQLIEQVASDINAVVKMHSIEKLGLLRSHALVNEQEQEDVKEIQIRRILSRVVDRLHMTWRGSTSIEEQLKVVLSNLQGKPPKAVGYAKINVLNLLNLIEGGLPYP